MRIDTSGNAICTCPLRMAVTISAPALVAVDDVDLPASIFEHSASKLGLVADAGGAIAQLPGLALA